MSELARRKFHGQIKTGDTRRLAETLRRDFDAELRFGVAGNRRVDAARFGLYYLPPRRASVLSQK